MRVVVIGAGMAGILSAIKLREAGYDDFVVYEKADRLGGTWRENTYPGISCDVPSHLYSYSFAPNPDWSHTFSPGSEIREYLEWVARSYGVDGDIHYGTEITQLTFDARKWRIEGADGLRDEADVVLAATGVLHHPRLPDIPGIDDFGGSCFHSSRWDHDVPLEGRRVGVIGTGSTAIQITCALVDEVAEYTLFQRTAQWVLPVENAPIDESQRVQFRDDPAALHALREGLGRSFAERFADIVIDSESPMLLQIQEMCQANLDSVADPELREKLLPDYRAACKRLILSPDFYEKIQRPNARVVTEPIERIEHGGVRTDDGTLHELDVVVLATGFRVDRFLRPIEVRGRDGVSLDEVWRERPSAYLAVSVPDFPNLFLINGPNGPVGNFSLIDVAEMQIAYILQLMALVADGHREVGASHEAAERFEVERVEAAKSTIWVTGCRSWYLDDRGVPAAWPWTYARFRDEMSAPNLSDYDVVARE